MYKIRKKIIRFFQWALDDIGPKEILARHKRFRKFMQAARKVMIEHKSLFEKLAKND